jgi:hypothetical protein
MQSRWRAGAPAGKEGRRRSDHDAAASAHRAPGLPDYRTNSPDVASGFPELHRISDGGTRSCRHLGDSQISRSVIHGEPS